MFRRRTASKTSNALAAQPASHSKSSWGSDANHSFLLPFQRNITLLDKTGVATTGCDTSPPRTSTTLDKMTLPPWGWVWGWVWGWAWGWKPAGSAPGTPKSGSCAATAAGEGAVLLGLSTAGAVGAEGAEGAEGAACCSTLGDGRVSITGAASAVTGADVGSSVGVAPVNTKNLNQN